MKFFWTNTIWFLILGAVTVLELVFVFLFNCFPRSFIQKYINFSAFPKYNLHNYEDNNNVKFTKYKCF